MKRKIDYNYDFLERWRVSHRVEKEEMMRVIGAYSRNNLDEWLGVSKQQREAREKGQEPAKKMLSLKHILSLCNHYGIDLLDFFESGGQPLSKLVKKASPQESETSLLELKVSFYEKMEGMRQEYDQRISDASKTIAEQEQLIKDLQASAFEQQQFIQQLQETISSQRDQIADLARASAGSFPGSDVPEGRLFKGG